MPRRIVIRNLQVRHELSPEYYEREWEQLQMTIRKMLGNQDQVNMEAAYRICEHLCQQNYSSQLLDRVHGVLREHIQKYVHVLQYHVFKNVMTRRVTLVLQPVDTKRHLWPWCIGVFRECVLMTNGNYDLLLNALRVFFDTFRSAITITADPTFNLDYRQSTKQVLEMFQDVDMFGAIQLEYVKWAQQYYSARKTINDLRVYMQAASKTMALDQRLLEEYMPHNNIAKTLQQVTDVEIVGNHIDEITAKIQSDLLAKNAATELQLLFDISERINKHQQVTKQVGLWVREQADTAVGNNDTAIQELLKLKESVDQLIPEACKTPLVHDEVRDAFEHAINQRGRDMVVPELLAKYIDRMMRGKKDVTGHEMDQVLSIFRWVHGKDTFEAFYKQLLSRRLLQSKSNSTDSEKMALQRMRVLCGPQFTTKLEGMFRDMELSRDIMADFKSHSTAGGDDIVELDVAVLTQGFWPTYPSAEQLNLPSDLSQLLQRFRDYFAVKYSGRKLHWQHSLDNVIVKFSTGKSVKELVVSLHQALVLLLFNDLGSTTCMDIQRATNLQMEECKRVLQSLACGKVRMLTKTPRGRDVADTDQFQVTPAFTHPLHRIKINQIHQQVAAKEDSKTRDSVHTDRTFQIDAAIVRIMKTRTRQSHQVLMQQTLALCKFPMTAQDFKRRVESLIEREYMQRGDQAGEYIYMA